MSLEGSWNLVVTAQLKKSSLLSFTISNQLLYAILFIKTTFTTSMHVDSVILYLIFKEYSHTVFRNL